MKPKILNQEEWLLTSWPTKSTNTNNSIKNIQEECDCLETSQLSISKNNLKMYQTNLFILSIGVLYIIMKQFVKGKTSYNFKKYLK